ncbi:MAG TPA: TadE/TadG family type IV pilus assembly protein [Stellaceae bacterium]|nr:TadE/TadG family type IV pilus assembly protein [Stellaceae bacterium]
MPHRVRTLFADRRGVAAIEFAFALPILCTMVFSLYEVAQGISCYYKLMDAANSVADLIGQTTVSQGGIGNTEFNNYYTAGQLIMSPESGSSLKLAMGSVLFTSRAAFSKVVWQVTRGGATAMTSPSLQTATANLGVASSGVIVVQATYSYSSLLNYFITTPITMSYVAYALPRNMTQVPCPPPSGTESCS